MDTDRLDLNLLVALEALLAERNVTRAARRMGLSQPALSARLGRLRDILGDPLLLPAPRGMIPTDRALALEGPLREALEAVRAALASGAAFDPALANATVSIAASDYVLSVLSTSVVLALREQAPRLKIAWRPIDGRKVGEELERGDLDLAIMTPLTAPDHLKAQRLFDEHYVCIARADHPRIGPHLDLETFLALDHAITSPRGGGFAGAADAALAAMGRKRQVVLSVSSFLILPEIIAATDLIALVPERLARRAGPRLRVFEPPLAIDGFTIGLVWHDRTTSHPLHRWLRDCVRDSFARD